MGELVESFGAGRAAPLEAVAVAKCLHEAFASAGTLDSWQAGARRLRAELAWPNVARTYLAGYESIGVMSTLGQTIANRAMTDLRITTARDLLLEATTTEVAGAFTDAGVSHMVLKGPVLKIGCSPAATTMSRPTSMSSWARTTGVQPRPSWRNSGSSHCCWTSSPVTAPTMPAPTFARPEGRRSICTAPCSAPKHPRPSSGASSTGRPSLRCSSEQADQSPQPGGPAAARRTPCRPERGRRRTHPPLPDTLHRDQRRAASGRRAPHRQGDRGNRRLRTRALTRPRGAGAEPQVRDHAQRFGAHRAQSCIGPQHRPRRRMVRHAQDIPRPCALRRPQDLPAGRLHGKLLPERPLARRPPARLPDTLAVARPPTASFAEGLEGARRTSRHSAPPDG